VITVFVSANAYFSLEYFVDCSKQEEIMRKLGASKEMQAARTPAIQDNTLDLNARGRHVRFYEYNGWFKWVFKDESRFAAPYEGWEAQKRDPRFTEQYVKFFAPIYNAAAHKQGPVDLLVRIDSKATRSDFILGSGDKFQVTFLPVSN